MPGTSAALETEWSLLLAACSAIPSQEKLDRIRLLLSEPIRWKVLFELADRHGTTPLLYQALTGLSDQVPSDELATSKQSYQTNLHKALLLSRELIRILDHLSALGVEVLPYKGLALAELIYGDIALRQSGDIDLLIRPNDLPRIREAVRAFGYTPHSPLSADEERAYLKSGYECAFDGTAGRNLLEVQWALQPLFYAVDLDMDGLFERAVTVSVAGREMKTPCPEDLFLVLSVHAAKHAWGRLIWLCDIAQIMRVADLDWRKIEAQSAALGITRILQVTLLLANRLLGAAIPPSTGSSLSPDRAANVLGEEIQARIIGGAADDTESAAYFRLMLRLRERRTDRWRFLLRLVFTPGPGEWKTMRLPPSLFPLYRLVRLSRLAVRLVRKNTATLSLL